MSISDYFYIGPCTTTAQVEVPWFTFRRGRSLFRADFNFEFGSHFSLLLFIYSIYTDQVHSLQYQFISPPFAPSQLTARGSFR